MKRLLALLLTLAMVMTMVTIPVSATTTAGNMKVNLSIPAENGGLYGKTATEYAKSMTTDVSNPAKALFTVTSSAGFDFSDKKYIVLDLNVAPNDSASSISVGPDAGLFTVESSAFIKNRWNSVRIVVEEQTVEQMQASGKYQPMTMYINGVKVGENASDLAGGDTTSVGTQAYGKGFRFSIKGSKSTMVGYVADVNISASDVNEAPAVPVIADGTGYAVSGNRITTEGTATVGDLTAANSAYSLQVYSDETFKTVLDNSAKLSIGNVVVAKNASGMYNSYDVADGSIVEIFSAMNGVIPGGDVFKATQAKVTAIGGKDVDDSVVQLTATTETDGNIMYQKNSVYTQTKKYFVIEGSIYPVDGEVDMTYVSVHTNNATTGHATVSGDIRGFEAEKWNKFLTYVDFTEATPKAYSYLNGALVKEQNVEPVFGDSSSNVRVCFHSGKAKEVFDMYLDDFRYYETDKLPSAVEATARPEVAAYDNYTVENGKFNIISDITLGQVQDANPDLTVRAFTNNTYKTEVDASAILGLGMTVVFETSSKAIATYPVAVSYGEKEIQLVTGDDSAKFPSVVNGSGETVVGIGGKDASDKVLAVTVNGDTFLGLNSWGTVVKTGADNSVTPSWDKTDYNGYLVVEASVFNIDNDNIALVTTQTGQVSGNVAALIPANQWARVKFVYNSVNGDSNEGKTMTYVDGNAVTGWVASGFGKMAAYATDNYMCNDIRLSMKGSKSDKVATYVDDIRVYETTSLREAETIPFTAPKGTVAQGYNFSYAEGIVVKVSELKALNPDYKVYNNATNYTEITDENADLADGNILVAMATSQAAQDAGLTYKDLYNVLTVGTMPSTKDRVTSFPASVSRGEVSAAEEGKYGNLAPVTMVTDANTADGNWFTSHGYSGLSLGMKYIVWEVDIAPDSDVKSVYFAANQHAALSKQLDAGIAFKANTWNKLVMVYDVENDTSDTYVNGTLVFDDFAGNYSEKYNNSIDLRLVVDCKVGSKCYIDTYKIYDSAVYPKIAQPATLYNGYANRILANTAASTASIYTAVTVADVADIAEGCTVYAFEDDTYTTQLGSDDTFEDGNILVLYSPDNLFTAYNVTTHGANSIVAAGDTFDGTGNMTVGKIGFYAPVTDGGVLFAAQYDAQGNLIKVAVDDTAEDDMLAVDFETEEIDKSTVRAFLFESENSIKPLCRSLYVNVRDYIDFLILGNSYSMDVTWHLREIAAADDVLMNVHVLNKGGCHLRYHYDNRQGNPVELGINFWENDVSLGTLYNLEQVLEKFDWDYVVIQGNSTSEGLDDTSEANYQENWAVAVPFAQYIHEMEPDARLVIHSTWSMEAGYNFVDDAAERDTILANMQSLNERCASEINSTLGLSGDDEVLIIYSSSVLDAARKFTSTEDITINGRTCAAGTKLFDTTYYKPGHIFSSKEVNVGDGSMLLSDEDRNAGKISLHRDGFHMSAVGRYLIALNAYATITGNTVIGNTFDSFDATRADGTIRLDSSPGGYHVTETDKGELTGTVFQTYDILTPEVRSVCQQIVDSIER